MKSFTQDYDANQITAETNLFYEKVTEFIEYANGITQNITNRYVVQYLIKTIFSNFSVDLEKVAAIQTNPIFEGYLKLGSILNGVGSKTIIEQIFEHTDDFKTTWNWLFNPTMTFEEFSLEKEL